MNNSHSIYGRYQLAQYSSKPDADPNNVLAYANGAFDDTVHSFVAGDTLLLGSNTVNSFRVTMLSSDIVKEYVPFFDAARPRASRASPCRCRTSRRSP